jgi:Tfp pilus assembly protein PilN
MTLFFTILGGVALGSFAGNISLFWVIGEMARRQEKKQREILLQVQQELIDAQQKETERMKRYAKMEG